MPQVVRPESVDEAAELLAVSGARAIAGGTDLMPDINAGRARPESIVILGDLPGWRRRAAEHDQIVLGAGVTYTQLLAGRGDVMDIPLLVAMAATVGTPASRNAGTLGGAIATARGNGDAVTTLLALDARVTVVNHAGVRTAAISDWLAGRRGKPDLVVDVRVPRSRGPAAYAKIMHRQASAPAVVNCAVVVDESARSLRCVVGGVGELPVRACEAEAYASAALSRTDAVSPAVARRFGELVAEQVQPTATFRASADYRRHAAAVLAARLLVRCVDAQGGVA